MKKSLKEYLDRFLKWLNTVLPTAVTVGSIIYSYMVSRLSEMKIKLKKVELEKELLENEKKVNDDLSGKSDRDIIMDAASEGNGSISGEAKD